MSYTYKLQTFFTDTREPGWATIKEGQRTYLLGYMDARMYDAPRLAMRILRSDGKVIEELEARDDVSVGQIAGFPTAAQYEYAAERALERARIIRETLLKQADMARERVSLYSQAQREELEKSAREIIDGSKNP